MTNQELTAVIGCLTLMKGLAETLMRMDPDDFTVETARQQLFDMGVYALEEGLGLPRNDIQSRSWLMALMPEPTKALRQIEDQ